MGKKRRSLPGFTQGLFTNYKKCSLVLLLFSFLAGLYFYDLKATPFHIDEHEFIRKSYYFDLFFTKRNLNDPRWYTRDAPQQPKLGPYIYGLTLHWIGINDIEKTLEKIDFHNINVGEISWWWKWWAKPLEDPPNKLIPSFNLVWQGRKVAILFSLCTLSLLFLFALKTKGVSFALLSVLLLGTNSLMFTYGRRAMTDSMQLFSFFFNLLLFWLFLKSFEKKEKKKIILLSLALGVNCAFGTGVKVSGILIFLFLLSMFLILFALQVRSKRSVRLLILSFSIITVSFLVIFVSLHPYLYHDTFRQFYSMFTDRLVEADSNRELLPLFAVFSRRQALKLIVTRTLFSPEIINFKFYGLPVDAFLFFAGFLIIGGRAVKTLLNKRKVSGEMILVVWSIVVILSLTYYLRLDLPRYYLPTVASITITQSYALIYLLQDIWFAKREKFKGKISKV